MSISTYGATDRRAKEKTLNSKVHNFKERDYSASEWSKLEQKILGNPKGADTTATSKTTNPYLQIPTKLLELGLSEGAIFLYLHLKKLEFQYHAKGGEFFHTLKQFSEETKKDKDVISRQLDELIKAGVVIKNRHGLKKDNTTVVRNATFYSIP